MPTVLENDHEFALGLPSSTIVTASAGSGKTTALKQRFIQLLLSRSIPNNSLKNILAITFTNNAAREMKQRVLSTLKAASLGKADTLEELQPLLSLGHSELQLAAGRLIDEILDNYSDFQIQTIDSFLVRVFKASALELGLSPDLDIILDSDLLLDEAFTLFARDLTQGSEPARFLGQLIDLLMESRGSDDRFLWNPYADLAVSVKELYKRIILTSRQLVQENYTDVIRELGDKLVHRVGELDRKVSHRGLVKAARFETYAGYAKVRDPDALLSHKFPSSPITKTGSEPKAYEKTMASCQSLCEEISLLREKLILLKARQHYQPYAEAHALLSRSIEAVKHEQNQVDIGDVVKKLAEYLKPGIVPEIYYSLGETLCHYMIDEFQDTNPIQWETLEPLIGNALATKGSLFVVGDTKQSIYGFRGADWRIMKRLKDQDVFPSARKILKALRTNFRSYEKILQFDQEVFSRNIQGKVIAGAESASGLSTDQPLVRDEFRNKGYVELITIPVDDGSDAGNEPPEKEQILGIVRDCLARGYHRSDITILSPRNDDIIEVSGWLNENHIAFISHSSLDVRSRKVTGELLALLRFLDSPIDDLSFATFLLGNIFEKLLERGTVPICRRDLLDFLFDHQVNRRHKHPLYASFREAYPDAWQGFFDNLFTVVGYLPLYDLLSEIYKGFAVFTLLPGEEATFVKILEVVKDFEGDGENSLKAFLRMAGESSEDTDWNIDIPTDIDAVRAMTIHKAKGLQSRVVIVLLYDSQPRRDGLYFEESGDEVRLVRVTKALADEGEKLAELYHEKELRHVVDDLNKLYVSLTRAEEEMSVISVKARRGKIPSEFLPEGRYAPETKPAVRPTAQKPERTAELFHDTPVSSIRPTEYSRIAVHETRRGEFFHAVMESIEYLEDNAAEQVESAIHRAGRRAPLPDALPELRDILLGALANPDLRPYFIRRTGRTILNEQEFTDADGALVRMDRVVVDPELVTVVDYKTGDEKAENTEQVGRYIRILKDYYKDRPVHGLLVYVDRNVLRTVA